MECQVTTKSVSPNEEDKEFPKINKLKLSRSEEAGQSSSPSAMVRVCQYCRKEFSNGKALGGHIRIHTRGLKKLEIRQKHTESSTRIQDLTDEEAIEKRICLICDRVFPSAKSFFGHMRFHQERRYRGAPSSSSEEEEEDDQNPNFKSLSSSDITIDLLKDLPNWSRTDKRGRGSTCEAALNLIKLSSAVSLDRDDETLSNGVCRPRDDNKERVDRPTKSVLRFVCNTCGKEFPTFQALGGHRSSHNKDKTDNLRRQSVSASTEALEKKTAVGGTHQCDICRKNFPSGQALGGHKRCHKRCHWATGSGSGVKNYIDPDDQASEVGPDRGSGSWEPAMDIDLNKLPSMELDEDGSVTGNS